LLILSAALAAADGYILYLWLMDWKSLETKTGVLGWGAAILIGFILYVFYRKLDLNDRSILIGWGQQSW